MRLSRPVLFLVWAVASWLLGPLPPWLLGPLPPAAAAAEPAAPQAGDCKIDFRYAPPWWQTAICLPDDWQKTLVGKEGQLLYDFPGKFNGFKTRITLGVEGESKWVRQELVSPRIPIVRTLSTSGPVEVTSEAFAAIPAATEQQPPAAIQRQDGDGEIANWAAPPDACDPAFRDIAVGMNRSIRYLFRAEAGKDYTVVFGLCEGYWKEPGKRPLDLQIEGRSCKTVDLVREHGHNVPVTFACPAQDTNGDGWIEVAVAAAAGAPDKNTILNVLWVFEGPAPPSEQLLAGRANAAAKIYLPCGAGPLAAEPRNDTVVVHLRNPGSAATKVVPTLTIDSQQPIQHDSKHKRVSVGSHTLILLGEQSQGEEKDAERLVVRLRTVELPAMSERSVVINVRRGGTPRLRPAHAGGTETPAKPTLAEAWPTRREAARAYWQRASLPYDHIQVPDRGVQALLDSSIRNIYQAREIKKGLPAFQVGPTCYRGLWVVDGSFLLEAVTFLNRADEARNGIHYLLSFQRDDGAIMIMDGHWKETGITLWAVARHARLTNDPAWLRSVWPQCERGFQYIRAMRETTRKNPQAPEAGLIPVGFSDGGLGGKYPEYTNVYWTLVGMKAAVEAAQWLGKAEQAKDWSREYDDFLATFRRAAQRDMQTDAHGNRFLPIRMVDDEKVAPQKAQWAFLHAVFPGRVFASDDPLVQGNMAMLRAVESEGLVFGTGWLSDGIWNYFGGFYGNAWLWLGDGQKAAQVLYAFGNHAAPMLLWREEHMPQGQPDKICGDMPHNWASAEFIRLVRNLLVFERGSELHLLEGLPPAWIVPGKSVRVRDALTEFGPVSFELQTSADGTKARLHLEPLRRNPPQKVIVHVAGWSSQAGTLELPADQASDREISLRAVSTY